MIISHCTRARIQAFYLGKTRRLCFGDIPQVFTISIFEGLHKNPKETEQSNLMQC